MNPARRSGEALARGRHTPACSGGALPKPWRSFAAHRMPCIPARASAPATAASSIWS